MEESKVENSLLFDGFEEIDDSAGGQSDDATTHKIDPVTPGDIKNSPGDGRPKGPAEAVGKDDRSGNNPQLLKAEIFGDDGDQQDADSKQTTKNHGEGVKHAGAGDESQADESQPHNGIGEIDSGAVAQLISHKTQSNPSKRTNNADDGEHAGGLYGGDAGIGGIGNQVDHGALVEKSIKNPGDKDHPELGGAGGLAEGEAGLEGDLAGFFRI